MNSDYWVVKNDKVDPYSKEAVNMFLMDLKLESRSKQTIIKYHRILEKFLIDNVKDLRDIHSDEIHRWLSSNYGNRKPATYNLSYHVLSSFFNYCIAEDLLANYPVKRRWKMRKEYHIPKYLTQTEVARVKIILDKESLRNRTLMYLLFSSGCRRGEIKNLTWDKVDLDNKFAIVLGKGNVTREVEFDDMTAYLLGKLKSKSKGENSPVFLNKYGEKLSAHAMNNISVRIGKKTHLEHNLNCHRCRHTYATFQLSKGFELEDVRIKLGHTSLDNTCIYASVVPEKLRFVYRKIMG